MPRVLTGRWDEPDTVWIERYLETGGYQGLREALAHTPAELIDLVKASGLRGRGGAGFPTGVKWSFVPQDTGKPTYLVVNFDESEPGTYNNRELVERDPHQFLEGSIIAAYAVQCHTAFIYCRGEFLWPGMILERVVAQAYDRGFLGKDILGSGYDLDVVIHRGAGAYICGEETALLSSLEGYRGQPRLRPPFPAVEGLYASPTLINNVETLANVPHILERGADWFKQWGTEKSPGTKLFSVSGKVERPGNYEAPLGTPARVVIEELAGGVLGGKRLKAWTPGGSSTPFLTEEHLDVGLDFEDIQQAGSLLGTGAIMVCDESDCMVEVTRRLSQFYAHESCGKCTPCREGTWWVIRVLGRIESGYGRPEDIALLEDQCRNMLFRGFCALVDGAVSPIASSLKFFREEYERHIEEHRCPVSGAGPSVASGFGQERDEIPHAAEAPEYMDVAEVLE
ncbi:MAG TPA: NADH-quinone oxidoreductase subunit NuoF [Actinomycetota bacterium]|jgi:NADH-quinone oxidoreductase subunit F|nr:NADH-quinone oxidoreductase subunit NuoF [Actinomycetota bacterium]